MKTKLLILTAALTALPVSIIYANDAHHPNKMSPGTTMKGGMGMMGNMHTKMQNMMQQMNEIRNTKDPDKRDYLIDKHMKSMREGMKMMDDGMMGGKGKMAGMSNMDKNKNMNKEDMQKRMSMMEERMNMMQGMMGQMMNHSLEKTKTSKIRKRLHKQ